MDIYEWKNDVKRRKELNEEFRGKTIDLEKLKEGFTQRDQYPEIDIEDGIISITAAEGSYDDSSYQHYRIRVDSKNRIVRILKATAEQIGDESFKYTEWLPSAPKYWYLEDALIEATGGIPEE